MLNRIITLSIIALLIQSVAMAGGDITPVEQPTAPLPLVHDNNGLYLGLGVTSMNLDNDLSKESFSATGIMFQAGYQFNQYIALEGRYTMHLDNLKYDHGTTTNPNYSDYPGDFSNVGIYIKPMYHFNDFSIYGLLGYGEVTLTDLPYPGNDGSVDRAEDGFQWGVGLAYAINHAVSIYADYVNAYDDKGFDYRAQDADITSELWTLGVSYRF